MPSSDELIVRVIVVFGGCNDEHTIPCVTTAGILPAIDCDHCEVLPVGITPKGQWLLIEDGPAALELSDNRPPVTITAEGLGRGRLTASPGDGELTVLGPMGPEILGRVDIVLPLLHGLYGEDGTIQDMLEIMGIPHVGCGVLASAAGMDKQVIKVLSGAVDIVTAPHVVVGPHAWKRDPETILEAYRSLACPLFVRSIRVGSSLGISKVGRPEDLAGAIEAACAVGPKVLVESGIVGHEAEVAVLQGRNDNVPRIAGFGEIAMDASQNAGEFYDYKTKYLAHDAVTIVCPACIGPEARDLPVNTAARTFEMLGYKGLARVDFFLTDAGEVVISEINTMPGSIPFSIHSYMRQASGLDCTELVSELIELAAARPTDVNH